VWLRLRLEERRELVRSARVLEEAEDVEDLFVLELVPLGRVLRRRGEREDEAFAPDPVAEGLEEALAVVLVCARERVERIPATSWRTASFSSPASFSHSSTDAIFERVSTSNARPPEIRCTPAR